MENKAPDGLPAARLLVTEYGVLLRAELQKQWESAQATDTQRKQPLPADPYVTGALTGAQYPFFIVEGDPFDFVEKVFPHTSLAAVAPSASSKSGSDLDDRFGVYAYPQAGQQIAVHRPLAYVTIPHRMRLW